MIGQNISHYKILEKLGEGGMGIVYKAQDTKLDRLVALKFLPHHLIAHESEKARFVQEAKAAAALNHPNICTIHGIEEHEDQQFIVMEFVDGATLRQKLEKGSLSTNDAIGYAIQIGEALQEAHSKGIVHRDIKSENVMVNSKNNAKVMDFGLAKLKGSLKLTRTSSTVGTLAYMAPERIEGQETDARSDVFSFGIVVYEMLTGHTPFRGEHEAAVMYSIVNEEPQPIQKFLPDVSSELVHVLNRALEKDPDDRYQSVGEMVIDLRRLKKESTKVSRDTPVDRDFSRPGERARVRSMSQRSKTLAGIGMGVLVIGVVAYVLFLAQPKPIDSIAVLPFVNASADSTAEYLADGITEHLINDLTKISKLRVIPRSTVFHYKRNESDPLKVGRDLKVAVVVTGKFTQRGENLTLQTELLDVREESQLWGEQYKRRISDILSLQEDIAKDIADKLRLKLSGDEQKQFAKKHSTENPEAYELYLKGRYQWNKRTEEGLQQAIQLFEQAIEKDPKYAAAYAGLADVYATQAAWAFVTPSEAYPHARAAALRSLDLDQKLAEPYVTLASIKESYDKDWRGAEQDYGRSLELNPGYAHARHWYGLFLSRMGKHEEAIAELRSADKLDPLSPMISSNVGRVLYNARRYDQAIQQLRKTIDMHPEFTTAYILLGITYGQLGLNQEAAAAVDKANKHPEVDPDYGYVGWVYARAGRKIEAQRILRRLQELSRQKYIDPGSIAIVYLGLGQDNQALIWLQRALDVRGSFEINLLNVDPVWDPLRNDSRFHGLLKKMGFEK